jgi:hypothetical protein
LSSHFVASLTENQALLIFLTQLITTSDFSSASSSVNSIVLNSMIIADDLNKSKGMNIDIMMRNHEKKCVRDAQNIKISIFIPSLFSASSQPRVLVPSASLFFSRDPSLMRTSPRTPRKGRLPVTEMKADPSVQNEDDNIQSRENDDDVLPDCIRSETEQKASN